MGTPAMIFFGIILLFFAILDIRMIISLIRPGDERKQLIVWKASTYTLLVTVLAMAADIITSAAGLSASLNSYMKFPINTLIRLELIAIVYFIALLYLRKKYGD